MRAEDPSGRTAAAFLGTGVAFDIAFNGARPGLSAALFVLLAAASSGRVVPRASRPLLATASVLGFFVAIRASASLVSLDALAVVGLLVAAAGGEARELASPTITGAALAGLRVAGAALAVPRTLARPLAPAARMLRLDRVRPAARVAAVAVPVVGVFALLLGSADHVFADVVTPDLPDWNVATAAGHAFLAAVGTALAATAWRAATAERTFTASDLPSIAAGPPRLSTGQWSAVLAGVDLVFAAFVAVQFAVLFGGRDRVLVTPGLTYAEYARSGFFQLIAVAILTFTLLVALWDAGDRRSAGSDAAFKWLSAAMIAMTFVILVSAFVRLRLYERTFGFTVNRFYAYVIIFWIGAALVAAVVCLWTGARRYLFAAGAGLALVALLAVNVANPERFVAERNVERWAATRKLDAWYLGSLGADAVPVAAALLPRLDPETAADLRAALCGHFELLGPEPNWQSANAGRSAARRALAGAGITAAACDAGAGFPGLAAG